MGNPDFDLFTALRYDPVLSTAPFNTQVTGRPSPYLLFPYHFDRLVKAAHDFGWPSAANSLAANDAAEKLKAKCDEAVKGYMEPDKANGLRLRVLLSADGATLVEAYPAPALTRGPLDAASFAPDASASIQDAPSPVLQVCLDTQPTPSSVFTSYKTTSRAHYEAARARAGLRDRTDPREVVLYNEHGEVTEGSYRNVAFWRDGGWVTPGATSGGLPGTVRRWLLENGMVREGTILKSDVRPGEWVLLSNGVDITILGKVVAE